MVAGSPLEDARHLAQHFSRMRQEAKTHQALIPENVAKLQLEEAKMQELKTNMAVLGKEATAAIAAVESQQHRVNFHEVPANATRVKNTIIFNAFVLCQAFNK